MPNHFQLVPLAVKNNTFDNALFDSETVVVLLSDELMLSLLLFSYTLSSNKFTFWFSFRTSSTELEIPNTIYTIYDTCADLPKIVNHRL